MKKLLFFTLPTQANVSACLHSHLAYQKQLVGKKIVLCLLCYLCTNIIFAQDRFTTLTPKFSTGIHSQGFFTDASAGIKLYEDSGFFCYVGGREQLSFSYRLSPYS